MPESSQSKPPVTVVSYDNSFIKFAKIGALVVTSPLIAAVLICMVPLLFILVLCGSWVAIECLPILLAVVILTSAVILIRKRMAKADTLKVLSDRISEMELELHDERTRIHHLEEEVTFYKNLLMQKKSEP